MAIKKSLTVKINNLKLNIFKNLLEESLIVNNELILEFSSKLLKSCSNSNSKSLMKLWIIPMDKLINSPIEEENTLFDTDTNKPNNICDIPTFNFYILKGDLFIKFLSVYDKNETIDLEFILTESTNQNSETLYQANSVKIIGKADSNSPLIVNFQLTTEEYMSSKIDDYSAIIKMCTPEVDDIEILLTEIQIKEIRNLIKKLHKTSVDNTALISFTINNDKITVNDKIFNITFDLVKPVNTKNELKFNILKSDFLMSGNHSFNIYVGEKSKKTLFGTTYVNSIIWCLLSSLDEISMNLDDSNILDSTLSDLNLEEYGF